MIGTVFRDSEAYTYQALPASYDGKVFMMEYGANWVKYATLDDEGEVMEVDPFMPDRGFSSPFDMAVGPDGALYIMERGGGTITRFALDSSVLPVDLSVDSQISGGEIFVTKDTPVEVTATVTNDSRTGINDVELGLDSDADVRVSDGNNTSADSVGGGSSLTADWAVTLPGDLASGSYTIEATATYTSNGSEFTLSSSFSFTVTG